MDYDVYKQQNCEITAISFDELIKQRENHVQFAYCKLPYPIDTTKPELEFVRGPRKYVLGRFHTEKNQEIIFEAVPATWEVGYFVTSGEEIIETRESTSSPLKKFIEVSPESCPVPEMLIEMEANNYGDEEIREILKGRDIVEDPEENSFGFSEQPTSQASHISWCTEQGAQIFRDTKCYPSSYNPRYCDWGAWTHHIRTTGTSRRKASHARVATCGVQAWHIHFYRGWSPFLGYTWFMTGYPGNGHTWENDYNYSYYHGSIKRRRRVETSRESPSPSGSFFRVSVGFHN